MEDIRLNKYGKADFRKDKYNTEDLLDIMQFLRSPQGCPWDREQTHISIRGNAVEEAYEVVDAINSGRPERICDELGDLLLQIVFHSRMAEEAGDFSYDDVVRNICEKLISRHTHLFGENSDSADSAEKVLDIWDKNKKKEKNQISQSQSMDEIPRSFPSLLRAYKIQKKAAKTGFDWTNKQDVAAKVEEEFKEIREAKKGNETEEEIGDLLFSIVNYSRFLNIDPEIALDRANNKFIRRFKAIEDLAEIKKLHLSDLTLAELDDLWRQVKENET